MTMNLRVRSPAPINGDEFPIILWGGIVHLEVENPPDDWQTAGYTITWYANDSEIDSDHLKIVAGDHPTVQWDTSSVLRPPHQPAKDSRGAPQNEPKEVTVTVELRNGGLAAPLVASFTIDLYSPPKVKITEPANDDPLVVEGHVVELKATLDPLQYGITHHTSKTANYRHAEDLLKTNRIKLQWKVDERSLPYKTTDHLSASWDTTGASLGTHRVKAVLVNEVFGRSLDLDTVDIAVQRRPLAEKDTLPVALQRAAAPPTRDQALWVAIRNRTKAIAFSGSGYKDFIDAVLCKTPPSPSFGSLTLDRQRTEYGQVRRDPTSGATTKIVAGVGAYELLKTATEAFLLLNCGVAITERDISSRELLYTDTDEATRLGTLVSITEITNGLTDYLGGNPGRLPYIKTIIKNAFPGMEPSDQVHCDGFLVRSRVEEPCLLELIWSYWHEEGMLVQTMNAISRRFQNLRSGAGQDPLAHLEIDPIRPLNNLLWGYIQDEQHRLTVQRRAYEYDHQYGMTLYGKAVPPLQSADSRSKFLEAYHNLLHLCTVFYLEDDDTTRIADAFQLLNALKETHLLLALGATNQAGDLQWTARAEMLMQQ